MRVSRTYLSFAFHLAVWWKGPICIQMAGCVHKRRKSKTVGRWVRAIFLETRRKSVNTEERGNNVPGGAKGTVMGKLAETLLADSGEQRPRAS